MAWLENLVAKLAHRVGNQIDDLANKKAFAAAQDAMMAKDLKTALAGFEALAEKGHGRAAALAGSMYITGNGVKENGAKALKYLTIGKEAGDPDAITLLGMAYGSGKAGIKIDYIKARPLLEVGAKNGDQSAKQLLEFIMSKQKGKQP